jgi:hypothetical protein
VSPISVPTCSRRLDTVAAPKPFSLILLLRPAVGQGAEKIGRMEGKIGALAKGTFAEAQAEAEDERYVYPVDIWFRAHASAKVEQAWQVAEGLLGRIAEEARQHGAEPMLDYAERNHVSVQGFFNTPPNRGHWNEVGNAAAAGIVIGELFERSAVIRSARAESLQAHRAGPDR